MPIYEYACEQCGHQFDALQKIHDDPLRQCPECGEHKLRRLVSAPQFRLKGTGWYETDFKGKGEQKRWLADGGGEGAGSGAEAGKADAGGASAAEASPAKTDAAGTKSDTAKAAKTASAASDRAG